MPCEGKEGGREYSKNRIKTKTETSRCVVKSSFTTEKQNELHFDCFISDRYDEYSLIWKSISHSNFPFHFFFDVLFFYTSIYSICCPLCSVCFSIIQSYLYSSFTKFSFFFLLLFSSSIWFQVFFFFQFSFDSCKFLSSIIYFFLLFLFFVLYFSWFFTFMTLSMSSPILSLSCCL